MTGGWQRLSPLMLLVHPVRSLQQLLIPLLVAVFGLGQGDDKGWLVVPLVASALVVPFGVITWLTTAYRLTDEQLQRRSGWLSKKLTTAPLDRVRSVDVEASPVLRLLGLAKVKVGTGVDDQQIELEGLRREQADELRTWLLRRASAGTAYPGAVGPVLDHPVQRPVDDPVEERSTDPGVELARIDWSWLRYAPFSLSSLVVVAGAAGVLAQFGDDLPVDQTQVAQDAWAWIVAQALLVLVALVALGVGVGWVLVSLSTYVLSWWNLRVLREPGGSIRTTRGLLTTRSQTVERARIRGAVVLEPFLLRFVGGAQLQALATGVGSGGSIDILPPSPRRVVESVGHDLLEEDGPLTMTLRRHGPRARRRSHVSRQQGTLLLAALSVIPLVLPRSWRQWWILDLWPWWGPLAVLGALGLVNVLRAESAWRNLGHGLTEQHLVVQTGAVIRTRQALERAGIIGWSLEQSFWQRRLGLTNLVATTAVGAERLVAPDMPVADAVRLARSATPGMLEPFVR